MLSIANTANGVLAERYTIHAARRNGGGIAPVAIQPAAAALPPDLQHDGGRRVPRPKQAKTEKTATPTSTVEKNRARDVHSGVATLRSLHPAHFQLNHIALAFHTSINHDSNRHTSRG